MIRDAEYKGANFATVVLLLFGMLYLTIGMLSYAGVSFFASTGAPDPYEASPAGPAVLRGLLLLASALALATRTVAAPYITASACVLVLCAGMFSRRHTPSKDDIAIEAASRHLAVPPFMRSPMSAAQWTALQASGYKEPALFEPMLKEREAKAREWLNKRWGDITKLRGDLSKSYKKWPELAPAAQGGLPDQKFIETVAQSFNIPPGARPEWFYTFQTSAYSIGLNLNDSEPRLSREQTESIEPYAREWAESNVAVATQIAPVFFTNEPPEREPTLLERDRAIFGLFWVVLLVGAAVFIARESFTEPLSPADLPVQALRGIRRLVRRDATAWVRLIGGFVFCAGLLGIGIALTLSGVRFERATARLIGGIAMMGAMVCASGIKFDERQEE